VTDAPAPDTPLQALKKRVQDPTRVRTRANAITAFRVLFAVPMLILMYQLGPSWWTWSAWAVLAFTDYLDGWLARRDGATHSGAFLDPLADKVLTLGGYGVLAATGLMGTFGWVIFGIVAFRELGISVFRSLALRRGLVLKARKLGKLKTVAQLTSIGLFVWPPTQDLFVFNITVAWLAVALTIVSGLDIVTSAHKPESNAKAS
jgi:CDP-diacylglycerol--glycerol-3-phosphate 3-phosphatidyltransferase